MQQDYKTVIIDGARTATPQAVHAALAAGLGLPQWYGANLDALHDCLGDTPGAMVLLRNADALGKWGTALRRALAESAAENPRFLFVEIKH